MYDPRYSLHRLRAATAICVSLPEAVTYKCRCINARFDLLRDYLGKLVTSQVKFVGVIIDSHMRLTVTPESSSGRETPLRRVYQCCRQCWQSYFLKVSK